MGKHVIHSCSLIIGNLIQTFNISGDMYKSLILWLFNVFPNLCFRAPGTILGQLISRTSLTELLLYYMYMIRILHTTFCYF